MTNEKAIRLIRNLPTMCEFADAYGEPIDSDDYYDAVDMAVSALEKQIPKKPVMDYGFAEKIRQAMIRNGNKEKAEYKTDCCPICKRPLGVSKFVQSKTGLKFGDLYCKHCGQAILWE